jgi:glucokinase
LKDKFVIGVDLGGTKICAALVSLKGSIIYEKTIPTNVQEGDAAILSNMAALIEGIIKKCELSMNEIKGIGIGAPGPLNLVNGEIICTPNLPFKNFNIVNPLRSKFNVPVYLDNDANAAAIGEYMFGAGRGSRNMIFITVSTGIGAGAVLNGDIYRGNTQNALEVGHMTLKEDGPLCNCGNRGCAEVLASGTAIAREAKRVVKEGTVTSLCKYKNITAKEVFKEAKLGDHRAKEILNRALNYLGICVANVMNCFDPEVLIIGGGVSEGDSMVIDEVKRVVKKRCFKIISENTKICRAELGTNAGVIGAAALAILESKKV